MKELRYVVRNGRFGAFFYDRLTNSDLDLERVQSLLNELEELKKHMKIHE